MRITAVIKYIITAFHNILGNGKIICHVYGSMTVHTAVNMVRSGPERQDSCQMT